MTTTTKIKLSDDVIEAAQEYLDRLPKTTEEVIEHWARLGQRVAGNLTELEAMNLMLGNVEIELIKSTE